MANLKYYKYEQKEFEKYWDAKLNDSGLTQYFFDRLKAHYKFRQNLQFSKRGGGKCNDYWIRVGYSTNVGILAHEVAHAIDFKKRPPRLDKKFKRHSKKHLAIMKRVLSYIDSHTKEWCDAHVRNTSKDLEVAKARMVREAEREAYKKSDAYKLENLLVREKKLLTKQKRINTLLKKVQKKIKRLEAKKNG